MSIDYLRVSVTDRCNLRCVYCNPLGESGFINRDEILTFEEIHRIVRLLAGRGIRKVRLTGGEPLIRKNVTELVKKLASIEGIDELVLTTNGILLGQMAAELKEAGLDRVNISIDSVGRANYKDITGFDFLEKVTQGLYKALEVGLGPVKLNSVIIKGVNDSAEQILSLAGTSVKLPVIVRFIEYYPTGNNTKPAGDYVPNGEIKKIIEEKFGQLSNIANGTSDGPASSFKISNSAGSIGFISGRSSVFCETCNRLRLTSDGKIMPCLYSSQQYDLKKLIRYNATDDELLEYFKMILDKKSEYTKLTSPSSDFLMQDIGG